MSPLLSNNGNALPTCPSHEPTFHQFVNDEPSVTVSSQNNDSSPSQAFDQYANTEIIFEESNGELSVQSEPGVGSISLVLNCEPSRPTHPASSCWSHFNY